MNDMSKVRKLVRDLRELNPGCKPYPIGEVLAIDKACLDELKWPEGWTCNGRDRAINTKENMDITVLAGCPMT